MKSILDFSDVTDELPTLGAGVAYIIHFEYNGHPERARYFWNACGGKVIGLTFWLMGHKTRKTPIRKEFITLDDLVKIIGTGGVLSNGAYREKDVTEVITCTLKQRHLE